MNSATSARMIMATKDQDLHKSTPARRADMAYIMRTTRVFKGRSAAPSPRFVPLHGIVTAARRGDKSKRTHGARRKPFELMEVQDMAEQENTPDTAIPNDQDMMPQAGAI